MMANSALFHSSHQYVDLMDQLAPIDLVLQTLRAQEPDWPCCAAQRRFALAARSVEPLDRPVRYMKSLLKRVGADIEGLGLELDDELVDLRVQTSCAPADELDSGYCFYKPLVWLPDAPPPASLPLRVYRAHHEVGCRVWTAGVFLAALLQ
ncbi:hypothetical protein EON65_54755, partial [archaeon]